MIDLNVRKMEVHAANQKWWHDLETGERLDRNKGELFMLVISEFAEALEAERKNLMDSHLPHRPGAEVEMADAYIRLLDIAAGFNVTLTNDIFDENELQETAAILPENKAECLFGLCKLLTELVEINGSFNNDEPDVIMMPLALIFSYCHKFGYDLEGAYQEKMAYNAVRADHTVEARKAEGGKKF